MSKQEFIQNYIDPAQQKMASVLLPEETRSLEEWRSAWQQILNSPAR